MDSFRKLVIHCYCILPTPRLTWLLFRKLNKQNLDELYIKSYCLQKFKIGGLWYFHVVDWFLNLQLLFREDVIISQYRIKTDLPNPCKSNYISS